VKTKREVKLSHLGRDGRARMVDVGEKPVTRRTARAEATVHLGRELAEALAQGGLVPKGNVLETARLAGILAAKRTAELIPLCHSLLLDHVDVDLTLTGDVLRIETAVSTMGRTGAEMEAMTAASVAALTVYDMCKSAARGMVIGGIRLIEKRGGRSGHWKNKDVVHGT